MPLRFSPSGTAGQQYGCDGRTGRRGVCRAGGSGVLGQLSLIRDPISVGVRIRSAGRPRILCGMSVTDTADPHIRLAAELSRLGRRLDGIGEELLALRACPSTPSGGTSAAGPGVAGGAAGSPGRAGAAGGPASDARADDRTPPDGLGSFPPASVRRAARSVRSRPVLRRSVASSPQPSKPVARTSVARIPMARIQVVRIRWPASRCPQPAARIPVLRRPVARIPEFRFLEFPIPVVRRAVAGIPVLRTPLARIPVLRIPAAPGAPDRSSVGRRRPGTGRRHARRYGDDSSPPSARSPGRGCWRGPEARSPCSAS